jgi:transcription elongation factor GreB
MSSPSSPISPEGFEKLRAEWDQLFREVRPKLLEEIAAAAAQGDRSENAEYIYGRKKLREIDRRLRELDAKISRSTVVHGPRRDDKIYVGARVTLDKNGGGTLTVQLVGDDEIDPVAGKISRNSPLGAVLLGHRPMGKIRVDTPRGVMSYTITAVEYEERT